ncbi:cupin domain-containing protein [Ornithinimicrobium cerasi]|uniref:cupin domain-containing protein n=1 Tax=Ornithinimicrobium cerasi TaxID=2248773 RepID=UPI000F00823B|nr:cupin domain-containing protein [Ornithinimicrobium cerasi]
MTDPAHPVTGDLAPTEDDASSVVDLQAEGVRLLELARSGDRGRAVRSVMRQPGQNAILLAFPAGGGLPGHDAPGPASLLCLSGSVVLAAGEDEWRLPAGSAHVIPPVRHEVRAEVDSVCLLTVSLPLPADPPGTVS